MRLEQEKWYQKLFWLFIGAISARSCDSSSYSFAHYIQGTPDFAYTLCLNFHI